MPELIRTLTRVIQLDSALRRRLKMALFGPELSVNPLPCNAQSGTIIPLGSTGGQGQWEKPSSVLSAGISEGACGGNSRNPTDDSRDNMQIPIDETLNQ